MTVLPVVVVHVLAYECMRLHCAVRIHLGHIHVIDEVDQSSASWRSIVTPGFLLQGLFQHRCVEESREQKCRKRKNEVWEKCNSIAILIKQFRVGVLWVSGKTFDSTGSEPIKWGIRWINRVLKWSTCWKKGKRNKNWIIFSSFLFLLFFFFFTLKYCVVLPSPSQLTDDRRLVYVSKEGNCSPVTVKF